MTLAIKILTAFLLILILFIAAAYLLIPHLFNIDQIKLNISQKLQEVTGRKISIEKITPSFISGLGFKVEGFKIFEENGKDIFFSTDHLYITLHMSSLISGKFNPKKIIIETPDLKIERDEKGEFNINSLIASLKKTKRDPDLLSKILLRRIIIKKGNFKFHDFLDLKNPSEFKYEELEINIKNFSFLRPVGVSILTHFQNGKGGISSLAIKGIIDQIPIDLDPKKFKVSAKLTMNSFNLLQFFPYYRNLLPFPNMDGIADIKADWTGNLSNRFSLKGNMKFSSLLIDYPKFYGKPVQASSAGFKFHLTSDKDSINIKDYQIRIKGLVLSGSCLLENLPSENRNIALEINSNPFLYEEWKKYIPVKVMPASLTKFLTENLKGGEVKLNSLKLTGSLKDLIEKKFFENPNLMTMETDFRDIEMLLTNDLSPAKIIEGNLIMKDGDMTFFNSKGSFGKSPWQLTSGKILNLYKLPHMVLNLKCEPRTYEMTEFFKAGFIPEAVRSEVKEIQYPMGFAKLSLFLGKVLNKETPFDYRGELVLNGGGFLYQKLKSPFYNLKGIIRFNNDEISLNQVAGKLKDSDFTMNGTVKNYKKEAPLISLALGGNISSSVIIPLLTRGMREKIKPDGFLDFRFGIEGKINAPKLKGKIDLTELEYRLGEEFIKQKFHPNELNIEGELLGKKNLHIDRATIILGTNQFRVVGDVYDLKHPSLNVSLKTEGIDLKEAQQDFPFLFKYNASGTLRGEVYVAGNIYGLKELKLFSNLGSDDATLKIDKFKRPLKKIGGNFTLSEDSFSLDDTEIDFANNRFILNGKITNFKTPKISLDLKTSFLDLNKLLSKFKFTNLELSDLSSSLSYKSKILDIKKLEAKSWDGDIFLKGWIDYSHRDEYQFQFSNETKNSDIKKLLNYLGLKDSDMRGKIDIKGTLASRGRNDDEIKRSLNGHISIVSKNGKIKKTGIGILSKVLTFFNIFKWHEFWIKDIQVNGMPYKSLIGDFYIKNGTLSTDNLFLDGNAMKISAVGAIDIGKGIIDMKLGVQPLGTVDTVVSNIPVIGYILGGDNKSIVTAYFKVTGDIKNPSVESIPIQSLGKGIIGIFKRLLTYPGHLISPKK